MNHLFKNIFGQRSILFIIVLAIGVVFGVWAAVSVDRVHDANKLKTKTSNTVTVSSQDINGIQQALQQSIASAADYLVQNQLSNGELAYQANSINGNHNVSPSYIRLIAGAGSLYTACNVIGNFSYCDAGDKALNFYLNFLIEDKDIFDGFCFYSRGSCQLGGAALTIDAIYKRWKSVDNISLDQRNLLKIAEKLGKFIIWMHKPDGGFYHRIDPLSRTVIDKEYFVVYYNGESLMALLELFEMTGNKDWLEQAHNLNSFMKQQKITEDHWHGYAFKLFAQLVQFTEDDHIYASKIAQTILDNKENLELEQSSISAATKVEALASIALAFQIEENRQDWIGNAIKVYADFVMDRQLPNDPCNWKKPDSFNFYKGGIFVNCKDPTIRIDALQHWINGAATYLEYLETILSQSIDWNAPSLVDENRKIDLIKKTGV